MKKKMVIVVAALLLMLPASVFAGGFLGLSIGAGAILNVPFDLKDGGFVGGLDPKDITPEDIVLGADIRLNVSLLELSALVNGGMDTDSSGDYTWIDGYIGLGASIELLGLIDLGLTAGPMLAGYINEEGAELGRWKYDGTNYVWESITDAAQLKNLPLVIRATADVNLGGFSVGGFLMVESNATFADLSDPDFTPEVAPFGTAGISVLLNLL